MKAEMPLHKTKNCLMYVQWVVHQKDLPLKVEHKYEKMQNILQKNIIYFIEEIVKLQLGTIEDMEEDFEN